MPRDRRRPNTVLSIRQASRPLEGRTHAGTNRFTYSERLHSLHCCPAGSQTCPCSAVKCKSGPLTPSHKVTQRAQLSQPPAGLHDRSRPSPSSSRTCSLPRSESGEPLLLIASGQARQFGVRARTARLSASDRQPAPPVPPRARALLLPAGQGCAPRGACCSCMTLCVVRGASYCVGTLRACRLSSRYLHAGSYVRRTHKREKQTQLDFTVLQLLRSGRVVEEQRRDFAQLALGTARRALRPTRVVHPGQHLAKRARQRVPRWPTRSGVRV